MNGCLASDWSILKLEATFYTLGGSTPVLLLNLFLPNPAGQVHIISEPGWPGIGLGTIHVHVVWTKYPLGTRGDKTFR